jgi:hypothetical protein
VNRTGRSARLRATTDHVIGDVSGRVDDAVLVIEPAERSLAADQSVTMSATIDLTRCTASDDRRLDAAANIWLDDDVALRLWITVEVYDDIL